uniref:DNA replication licensing factor MCM5 n=1 Tax=Schmidtea mediterranea TaxID=79327 RepID=M9NPT0_SCHMD|nr:MCM5 [Schmidtea mediterranea]
MAGFDEGAVYLSTGRDTQSELNSEFAIAHSKFKEFLKSHKSVDFNYVYRDILKENCNTKKYYLPVEWKHLSFFDPNLADKLMEKPNEFLPIFESVVNEVANDVTYPRLENENLPSIQIMLKLGSHPKSLREIKSNQISKLIKISGVVVSASGIKSKAATLTLRCKGCQQYLPSVSVKPGLNGYVLPRKCIASASSARFGVGQTAQSCPVDPYYIEPDKCKCNDFQILKLQEAPENVPHGEMPRHSQLFVDRYLCEKAVPGNRVTVVGISSIIQQDSMNMPKDGVKHSYIRVLNVEIENTGSTRSGISSLGVTDKEEKEFREFSLKPGVHEIIARSIAPGIYGNPDIKKAIACLLFGGSRKKMPEGVFLRGDINMMMLGDPGTAKSQLLKFVEQCAPIAVYTSGKGSSAAGLTASVIRDSATRSFVMEGGAMVLADGGVVCIDEFDKMKEDDRVAIHEAMEQQTISIAKAGITTMLNSRCSVLAAANSVFGHWDETKGDENIDFMPTIMSRFDMIFVVKDVYDEKRDKQIVEHVMSVHMGDGQAADVNENISLDSLTAETGIMPVLKLKKYIAFCRDQCGPRLTPEALKIITNHYVSMRSGASEYEKETGKNTSIPITIRQLEAIVRIAESLAKMRLAPFGVEADAREAIRLFQVSTLSSALTGNLEGVEGFTDRQEHDVIVKVEKLMKKRFVIGSQVSEQTVIQDFVKQGFPDRIISKVLHFMIRRGEIQPKHQRRVLMRVK